MTANDTMLPTAVQQSVRDLRSPDPVVRDEGAMSSLGQAVLEGDADGHLGELLRAAAELYDDEHVHARAFGPLLVAVVIGRDGQTHELDRTDVDEARHALVRWWLAEDELEGYDAERGWLHALAHGSDAVDELGMSRHADAAVVTALLDAVLQRLYRPTTYRMVQSEETRIAYTLARLLSRPEVTDDDRTRVVNELARAWRTAAPGPVGPVTFNVVAVASALHLQLSLGIEDVEQPPSLLPQLADALREMWPWSLPAGS